MEKNLQVAALIDDLGLREISSRRDRVQIRIMPLGGVEARRFPHTIVADVVMSPVALDAHSDLLPEPRT